MLEVQKFIRENSIEALVEKHKIVASTRYDDVVVLNYNQFESSKFERIVRECRGLILEKNTWNVVCRSFDRFFNHGECPRTNEFSVSDAVVQEKVDGSLVTAYFYNDTWHFSTRKLAFAEGLTSFGASSFRTIIDSVLDIKKLDNFDKNTCFIFELVSPETRVVKRYANNDLYLTGARNKETQQELHPEELDELAVKLKVKRPKQFKMSSFEEAIRNAKELPELEEGYVCLWNNNQLEDGSFYRLKIKNPAYLAVAHLRGNGEFSERRIINLVMTNEHEEYLTYFPEDIKVLQRYIDAFERMKEDITTTWEITKGIVEQKSFAKEIESSPVKSVLFQMRKKFLLEDIFRRMFEKTKVELIQKYLL